VGRFEEKLTAGVVHCRGAEVVVAASNPTWAMAPRSPAADKRSRG
jgi:hypothetical protein